MMTLCLTDRLAGYPEVTAAVHNLDGNIPYEVEWVDHRCLLDTPEEELPSARLRRAGVYVDCTRSGLGRSRRRWSCTGPSGLYVGRMSVRSGGLDAEGTGGGADRGGGSGIDLTRNAAAMLERVARSAEGERAAA
jgi:hypothetical protein